MPFPERLKERRQAIGLSQENLAGLMGVTRTAVINWEAGSREPGFDGLVRLSRILNSTTDYLLCRTDNPNGFDEIPEGERRLLALLRKHQYSEEMLTRAIRLIQMAQSEPDK